MTRLITCILLSATFFFQVITAAAEPTQTPKKNLTTELVDHDAAICLIYAGGFDVWSLGYVLNIYSTYKVEKECNEDNFRNLTLASMAAQLRTVGNTTYTVRGGYHRQLMSVNLSPVTAAYYEIGNIKFSPTGSVKLRLIDIIFNKSPTLLGAITATYTPFIVNTNLHYIWNIGEPVHQLVAPNGKKYLMYTYTNRIYPGMTRESLENLGQYLQLPPGWKYESFILDKTVTVRTTVLNNFEAISIFDELDNYYVLYSD